MAFLFDGAKGGRPTVRFVRAAVMPSWADLIALLLLAAVAVLIIHGAAEMGQPLTRLDVEPIVLDPARLPDYALRTTLRMFAALAASLLFTFTVATLAARSRKAELLIIPVSALVSKERTRIVVSPTDFRVPGRRAPRVTSPGWIESLYGELCE